MPIYSWQCYEFNQSIIALILPSPFPTASGTTRLTRANVSATFWVVRRCLYYLFNFEVAWLSVWLSSFETWDVSINKSKLYLRVAPTFTSCLGLFSKYCHCDGYGTSSPVIWCFFHVSWMGCITGILVLKENPPICFLLVGCIFSSVVCSGWSKKIDSIVA